MKKTTYLFLVLSFICQPLFAEQKTYPKVGLSATLQAPSTGIMVPVRMTERFVLAPSIDVVHAEGVGTDLGFALSPRYYTHITTIKPFVAARAGVIINMPADENSIDNNDKVDYLLALTPGAEYFISRHLSAGIEVQGVFTFSDQNSDRFGNPGKTNFNTGTMLLVTLWF